MNRTEILSKTDHTLLAPQAYHTASVCISPCYVLPAKKAFPDLTVCTVIGFPSGAHTTACKVMETKDAIANGADEVDMVINVGFVKDGRFDAVLDEIRQVKAAAGSRILKVIIETCLLTEDEKIRLCDIVSRSGADFIKTSTGFSKGGATPEDIRLMRKYCAPGLKIKAAGGISTLADAEEFLKLGADRLGSSRIVRLIREEESV